MTNATEELWFAVRMVRLQFLGVRGLLTISFADGESTLTQADYETRATNA